MDKEMLAGNLDDLFNDISSEPAQRQTTPEKEPETAEAPKAEAIPAPSTGQGFAPTQQSAAPFGQTPAPKPTEMPSTMTQTAHNDVAVGSDFRIGIPESARQSLASVGLETGEIGIKVSRVPIDRYKASATKVDRIGLISSQVIPIKYHYMEGVGSFLCFDGKCCEVAGFPTIRYLFPIVVYSTDSEGNVTGGTVSLKMLSLGEDAYRTIQTIHRNSQSMGGIDFIDLLVTCTDEHFQKMTFIQAGPAIWRQYSSVANFLMNKWNQDADKSYLAVARKLDEESLMRALDNVGSSPQEPQPRFDPMQSQDLSKFFN